MNRMVTGTPHRCSGRRRDAPALATCGAAGTIPRFARAEAAPAAPQSRVYLIWIIGHLGVHPATIGLLADDLIDVGFFITKRIKLEDLLDWGFQELLRNKDEHVKVLAQP